MLVKEVMSPKVEWVSPETPLFDCAVKMRDLNVGCLPVYEDGKISGMMTDRDIACRVVAEGRDPKNTMARDAMSKDIATCFDDADVNEAAHLMEEKGVARLPVLDHDNRMVGLLSLGDVSTHCSHELSGEVMESVAMRHH